MYHKYIFCTKQSKLGGRGEERGERGEEKRRGGGEEV
jgi:hypothetical protein